MINTELFILQFLTIYYFFLFYHLHLHFRSESESENLMQIISTSAFLCFTVQTLRGFRVPECRHCNDVPQSSVYNKPERWNNDVYSPAWKSMPTARDEPDTGTRASDLSAGSRGMPLIPSCTEYSRKEPTPTGEGHHYYHFTTIKTVIMRFLTA